MISSIASSFCLLTFNLLDFVMRKAVVFSGRACGFEILFREEGAIVVIFRVGREGAMEVVSKFKLS